MIAPSGGGLAAIDPGYAKRGKGSAVAVFAHGRLQSVDFVRVEALSPGDAAAIRDTLRALHVATVVWEEPQIDTRTRASTPAVVHLAAVGGTLAGMLAGMCREVAHVVPVAPSAWKGSTPKPVAHARLWGVLDEREQRLLGGEATRMTIEAAQRAGALARWAREGGSYYPGAWTMHNLLDAVGIGAWALGRVRA